jgi:Asp-tRNA(Asn)/Glu-tRNA(Gln) amidotransferase A subunit family amidase
MSELTEQSIGSLADLLRRRAASPVEIVKAHLDRIDRVNPKLNAIVTVASDLIEQAKDAEAAIVRGDQLGPLHGVPLTVKDTIETKGLRTTSGSAMRANFVPDRDAQAVARLKAAGAIILGKTNTAEMAMDYNADNPVFGVTNNPYDLALTPGGSSGGEAAAIASGMSPGGIGSDLAGSVRIPAHFCGVAGLKPTVGRVPADGQFPPGTGPYALGSSIGPMARSVRDLELLFSVLAGIDLAPVDLRGCRAAVYTNDGVSEVTDETRAAVNAAARALSDAGLLIEETRPPGVERGYELWLRMFSRASVVQLRNVYGGNEEKGGDFVRWRLRTADDTSPPSLDEYIQSWMERDRLRAALVDWMADVPLLIAPVGATPAYEHGTLKVNVGGTMMGAFRAFSYCQTFNVFDLPVVVVRAGTSAGGLPIGVQIIGGPFAEETVLAAAKILEQSFGSWPSPPMFEK